MDHMQAAQLLGVAAYTVQDVTHDLQRGGWVVKVRDMASHEVVERFIPAEWGTAEPATPDPQDHGTALLELAEAALVPTGTVPDVIEWVGTSAGRARLALDVELAKDKPRKTLVEVLQAHLDLAALADD